MSAPTIFDELGPNTSTIERWETWPIRLSQIKERDGHNPRKDYGEHDGSFAALVESIRERGILEPPRLMPIVDKRGEWEYQETDFFVVHGHRRVAAARALGLECIRCIVPDAEGIELTYYTEGQQLVDALVENVQRKDLNCIEVAEGIARLEKLGNTQADIAKWIGRDQGRVSKTVRLLELPGGVRTLLRDGGLSQSHGEELLPLLSESFLPGEIELLAMRASTDGLSRNGLRNVVQDKIKRGQPVQTAIGEVEDYAPAHNSPAPVMDDERIARTLASTKGMDKAELPSSSKEPKPTPKETNGLTRKEADAQFAAAMAPDPDVVPLSDRPAPEPTTEEHPRVILGHWLHDMGLNWIEAAEKLRDITGPGGDVHKPGMWFRLEPGTAQKLLELCDWHEGELGTHPMQEKLQIVVEVYHGLMLERRVEAEKGKAALSAGFPVFEEPS